MAKMVFYEPSVKVPLIVRPPKGTSPRVVEEPPQVRDLGVTFRQIARSSEIEDSAGSLRQAAAPSSADIVERLDRAARAGGTEAKEPARAHRSLKDVSRLYLGRVANRRSLRSECHCFDRSAAVVLWRKRDNTVRPHASRPRRRPISFMHVPQKAKVFLAEREMRNLTISNYCEGGRNASLGGQRLL
jgi:hypothetical protein